MQENTFRNEQIVKLGDKEILLRPTFENIAAMEAEMGGIAYLAFKYGKGVNVDTKQIDPEISAKSYPPLSETAKIIFHNQAEKLYTLDQIFQMVLEEGIRASATIVLFLVKMTAGNKFAKEPSERQKKSSSRKNRVVKS